MLHFPHHIANFIFRTAEYETNKMDSGTYAYRNYVYL